ncbi:hypothetical protein Tdes44962_MAKER08773 [Teratosphaeria destructans]|uniref:Uncharacterized protein n=1 Tax=Teratosphaeria destructans TaxID=418781 RepID=A0A9W7W408_9PEZI|nr:hypothetical protein Tdes44962_MAKER08773 [Teratosphaeria destructans]
MRTAAILSSAISLASLTAARIPLNILTEGYIQNVQDISVTFGIWPQDTAYPQTLGKLISTKYIGPDDSNVSDRNLTHYTHIPSDTPKGPATLTAAAFSFYGARLNGVVTYYTVNITVGDATDLSSATTSRTA